MKCYSFLMCRRVAHFFYNIYVLGNPAAQIREFALVQLHANGQERPRSPVDTEIILQQHYSFIAIVEECHQFWNENAENFFNLFIAPSIDWVMLCPPTV